MGRISELAMHGLVNAAWQIAAIAIGASICARMLRSAAGLSTRIVWTLFFHSQRNAVIGSTLEAFRAGR